MKIRASECNEIFGMRGKPTYTALRVALWYNLGDVTSISGNGSFCGMAQYLRIPAVKQGIPGDFACV